MGGGPCSNVAITLALLAPAILAAVMISLLVPFSAGASASARCGLGPLTRRLGPSCCSLVTSLPMRDCPASRALRLAVHRCHQLICAIPAAGRLCWPLGRTSLARGRQVRALELGDLVNEIPNPVLANNRRALGHDLFGEAGDVCGRRQ